MTDTYISFYLRNNRIHIFVEALRGIGCPQYVCILIAEDGGSLVLAPYDKKDFHSHRVSPTVYNGKRSLELTSMRLCKLLSAEFGWDCSKSYRVPGRVSKAHGVVVFNLRMAKSMQN